MIAEILQSGFMRRALLGGVMISLVTSTLGVFLILKQLSLIGDGLGHAAFGGIAIGFLLRVNPYLTALAVALAGSLGIQQLMSKLRTYGDAAIAVVLSVGMATAVVIIGYVDGFSQNLFGFLFGSILTTSFFHLLLIGSVLLLTGLYLLFCYRDLVYLGFNEDLARLQGGHPNLSRQLFFLLVGMGIVVSIQAVGVLLVTSLLVLPPLTALQVSGSLKETLLVSAVTSVVAMVAGIVLAYIWDLPSSGVIVLTMAGFFLLSLPFRYGS